MVAEEEEDESGEDEVSLLRNAGTERTLCLSVMAAICAGWRSERRLGQ